MAHSDEHLLSVLAKLEQCRSELIAHDSPETAEMVSIAILDLRMKLNEVGEAELKALCEELADAQAGARREPRQSPAERRPPLLRIVK